MSNGGKGMCVAMLLYWQGAMGGELGEYRQASRSDSYRVPTGRELAAVERLFGALLGNGESREEIERICNELLLETISSKVGEEEIVILREKPAARRGWGIYAFRTEEWTCTALEAPHSESDRTTGELVESMFIEGRCRAAAWNTAHRDTVIDEDGQVADLCRLEGSVMESFTRAYAAAHPEGVLIQVHGFHARKRTPADEAADVILSNGTRKASRAILKAASRLEPLFAGRTLVFPRDTEELGGTRNTHGKVYRQRGLDGFVHVELSMSARRSLGASPDLRRKFLDAFAVKQP